MRKTTLWSIALAMIFLIITFPFYVADAYAVNSIIDTVRPYGSTNTTGFMRGSDTLSITARALVLGVPEAEVANSLTVDFGTTPESFQNCEALGSDWYRCLYQRELLNMPGGTYTGNVILNAQDCAGACTKPVRISVDRLPPSFSSFTIAPSKTNEDNVTVDYSANDEACLNCQDLCAGIKAVLIYPSNDYSNILKTIEVNQSSNAPSGCADTRTFKMPVGNLPSGNYSICIAGLDNAGNINITPNTCTNLVIAREPPAIETPKIVDESGSLLTFLPGTGINAKVQAQVEVPYADLERAVVDLSGFQLENQTMACGKEEESRKWNCSARFLALLPSESTTQQISIFAYDDAGNEISEQFVFGLQADEQEPELQMLRTNYMFNNTPFLGPENNKIFLDLAETQSGFSKNFTYAENFNEYFDVPASDLYQAGCDKKAGIWTCHWPGIDLKQAAGEEAVLGFQAFDDVSNKATFSKRVAIDTTPPDIAGVEVHTQNTYPAIGAGENIVIRANITEDSAMVNQNGDFNIYLDLSMLEGGEGMRKADSCELINVSYIQGTIYNGSHWKCSWIIRGVRESHYWRPVINASDITGNQKEYYDTPLYIAYPDPNTGEMSYIPKTHIDVLPTEENVSNYWKVEMGTPSPASIDKQILPIVSPFVYVPLEFTSIQGSPELLQVSLEWCENDGTASEISIFPDIPEASNIELRIARGIYKDTDLLRYNCQVGIVSLVGGRITQKEIDNVTVGVGLYNMPLGRFDKNVKDKVDEVYEAVTSDFFKVLDFLKKTLDWINFLCQIYYLIANTLALFHMSELNAHIQTAICEDASLLILAPICTPISEGVRSASDGVSIGVGGIDKFMRPLCEFAYCRLKGWQSKYHEIIETMTPQAAGLFQNLGEGVEVPGGNSGQAEAGGGGGDLQAGGGPTEGETASAATRFITGSTTEDGGGGGGMVSLGNLRNTYESVSQEARDTTSNIGSRLSQALESSGENKEGGAMTGNINEIVERLTEKWADLDISPGEASEKTKEAAENAGEELNLGARKALGAMGAILANFVQFWPADMRESLILSTVFLCLPGVVYNIEKYRQIECAYGLCLIQTSALEGPLKACEEMHGLQTCLAVKGEIFNIIPYMATLDNIEAFLKSVFHDPVSFATFFTGTVSCALMGRGKSELNVAAAICKVTNTITNVLNWFTQMMNTWQKVSVLMEEGIDTMYGADMCAAFEEAYEEID